MLLVRKLKPPRSGEGGVYWTVKVSLCWLHFSLCTTMLSTISDPHSDLGNMKNNEYLKHRQDADFKSDYTSNLADLVMLEKIDRLFACNVGHYIDLPQVVVLGEQASGKSSVLEGLTNLPFPRDSGLCTRFATQIIFRRAHSCAVYFSTSFGEPWGRLSTWWECWCPRPRAATARASVRWYGTRKSEAEEGETNHIEDGGDEAAGLAVAATVSRVAYIAP